VATRDSVDIREFAPADLEQLLTLFRDAGWDAYTEDPERTQDAFTAPGSTTLVAVQSDEIVGFIQVQSDAAIQAHLSALLVDESTRGQGLGRRLLREGLRRAGGIQIDIRTRTEGYYERLGASRSIGYRLRRADLGLEADSGPDATP
jgi:ribosomal protein S18 acetylase RimI-like enzyme